MKTNGSANRGLVVSKCFELRHSPGNDRNSEGALIKLKDGTILCVYSHFFDDWGDPWPADLYGRRSSDGGESWSDEFPVVIHDELNVMSVSLTRLQDGRIALLYARKKALMAQGDCDPENAADCDWWDCRPMLRFSSDEGKSWSDPLDVTGLPPVYLVVNNDRLVQLSSGRLIIPVAYHRLMKRGINLRSEALFFLSDDGGMNWRESRQNCYPPQILNSGFLEPGVVELRDGRVMAFFRTDGGAHYKAFSHDGGETWSTPERATEFPAPNSPLSIKRNPETGELFAVWNDADPRWGIEPLEKSWQRTPLVIARSTDEGKSWRGHRVIEDAPDHGFCYTGMLFDGPYLFLTYCCGGGADSEVLKDSRIRRIDLRTL